MHLSSMSANNICHKMFLSLIDLNGVVLLHSQRFFGSVGTKDEVYFLSVMWSMESMVSHKCLKIYFAFEWRVVVNINRPKAWPSYKFEVVTIRLFWQFFLEWQVVFELFAANRVPALLLKVWWWIIDSSLVKTVFIPMFWVVSSPGKWVGSAPPPPPPPPRVKLIFLLKSYTRKTRMTGFR